jgi:drug/metabolite transporter (DMT)-like permease
MAVLFSAFFYGIGITINKIMLESVSPIFLATMTQLVIGILLAGPNLVPKTARLGNLLKLPSREKTKFVRRDLLVIVPMVLSGGVLAYYLFLMGLVNTTAVSAALLGNTEALFTVAIAYVFFRERGRPKDYAAMALLVTGAIVLTTNLNFQDHNAFGSLFGNLLVVGGCLFWSIDNNLSRLLAVKRNILQLSALKAISGGIIMLAILTIIGFRALPSTLSVGHLVAVGVCWGMSLLLFTFSLQEIGAMRTGVIFSTSSLFGAVSALFALHESISLAQALAGLVMLLAIYLLSIPSRKRGAPV